MNGMDSMMLVCDVNKLFGCAIRLNIFSKTSRHTFKSRIKDSQTVLGLFT